MHNDFIELRIKQLERSLARLQSTASVPRPPKGWIRAIREATGLSSGDLAEKLGTTRQLVIQQEKAESEDRITLKSLRNFAHALDCELVYALIPRNGGLEALNGARTRAKAEANVLGVEHSMALENQAAGNLDEAIKAEVLRLERKRGGK